MMFSNGCFHFDPVIIATTVFERNKYANNTSEYKPDEYDDDPSHEREREIAQVFRELRDGWAEIAREAEDAMESERDLQRDVQTLRELKQGHEHWIREYDDELQRIRKSAQESKRVYDEWVREFERDPSHFIEEYYLPDPAALVTESLEDDD